MTSKQLLSGSGAGVHYVFISLVDPNGHQLTTKMAYNNIFDIQRKYLVSST